MLQCWSTKALECYITVLDIQGNKYESRLSFAVSPSQGFLPSKKLPGAAPEAHTVFLSTFPRLETDLCTAHQPSPHTPSPTTQRHMGKASLRQAEPLPLPHDGSLHAKYIKVCSLEQVRQSGDCHKDSSFADSPRARGRCIFVASGSLAAMAG